MRWGFWEIILIVLLVVILFGASKIPAMMKNVAQGVKVFKQEIKEKPETKKATKKKAVAKKAK